MVITNFKHAQSTTHTSRPPQLASVK